MKNTHSTYALKLIEQLTLEEKIALVQGHNFMYTNAVPRLNIPSIRMSDGPHGLRVQDNENASGVMGNSSSTAFPTAATSSNSWNPNLLFKMGQAMGEEARYYGINIVLGPGVNIKRNPLCGRNFEYFSEDPILAGRLGAEEVKGLQSEGVGVSLKHFAFNNSENYRFMGNSVVDMRAARELYLRQFEYIVKETKPETLMCAYNQVNGTFCSENKWLLTDLLRDEWGYQGLVMSDWGASNIRTEGIKSGLDLEMPGDTSICRKWIYDAVNDKSLDIKELDKCVLNVLDLVNKHKDAVKTDDPHFEEHHELAKEIALESAVLLKNSGALPLNKDERVCVVGELFEKMRYQGAGSSMINPALYTSPKQAFDENKVNYIYIKGYKVNEFEPNKDLLDELVLKTKDYSKVVLFLGLTDYVETEGGDRENMSLSQNQLEVVNTLVKEGKKVVVVLYGGSVIELPFFDDVDSVLNMFLPGQNGGEATYELLFGLANPSGRLSETWPLTYKDVPFGDFFGKHVNEIYKESIYVGYRYYLSANKEVRFPFGYGLSYTSFEYSGLTVKEEKDHILVNVSLKNTGNVEGKEVVQVYVKGPESDVYKPLRELKGFTKVNLKPGEEKNVLVEVRKEELKYYDLGEGRFVLEDGEYLIQVGKSSADIIFEKAFKLKGEKIEQKLEKTTQNAYKNVKLDEISDEIFESMSGLKIPKEPKKLPITLASRLEDLKHTFMGRILYNAVLGVVRKDLKRARKMPDGVEKENLLKSVMSVEKMMTTSSLRSMTMSAGTQFPYNFAEGFMHLSNWHLIKGIKAMATKIKAPALPIEKEEK